MLVLYFPNDHSAGADEGAVLTFTALALQFLRIGDNLNGLDILRGLANDGYTGKYVNFRACVSG